MHDLFEHDLFEHDELNQSFESYVCLLSIAIIIPDTRYQVPGTFDSFVQLSQCLLIA